MTIRATVVGLLLGLGIAVFGYFNDYVLKQAYVASDIVPISVYGLLILGLLLVNPLLWHLGRAQLTGAEWCVIVSLMLVACVIPGPGLMWNFSNSLVMPHHFESINPGWQQDNLLSYAPSAMLIDPGKNYDRAVGGFIVGLRSRKLIGFREVPWKAWRRTLAFWLPLIGLSFTAGICLILVVHRQWAYRERLRYPVADFASQLMLGAGERRWAAMFHQRRFWIGFLPTFIILLINGYHAWAPESLQIYLGVPLGGVRNRWPVLLGIPFPAQTMFNPQFFFAAIGLAYFVSSDVSFSVGMSTVFWSVMFLVLGRAGVDMSGGYLALLHFCGTHGRDSWRSLRNK